MNVVEVRDARAKLNAELRAGESSLIDVLRVPPGWLGTATLGDLLCWAGTDDAICVEILDACKLNWGRRIEQLTERETWRVFAVVGEQQPMLWRRWRQVQRREAVAA